VGPSSSFAELLPPNEPDSVEMSSFGDTRGRARSGKTRRRRLGRQRQRRTRRGRQHNDEDKPNQQEGCGKHNAGGGFEGIDCKLYTVIESHEEYEYNNRDLLQGSIASTSEKEEDAGFEPPLGSALFRFCFEGYGLNDNYDIDMDALYAETERLRLLRVKDEEMDRRIAVLEEIDSSESQVVEEENNNQPGTVQCSKQLVSEEVDKHDVGFEPPLGSALFRFYFEGYGRNDNYNIDMDALYAETERLLKVLKCEEMNGCIAGLGKDDSFENHLDHECTGEEVVAESKLVALDSEADEKDTDGDLLLESYWLGFLLDNSEDHSGQDEECSKAYWLQFLEGTEVCTSEDTQIENDLPDSDQHSCNEELEVVAKTEERRVVAFNEDTEVRWHASKPGKGRFSRRLFPSYAGRFCNSGLEVEMSDKVVATTTEPLIDHSNYPGKQNCPRLKLKEKLNRLENQGQDWGYDREELKDYMFEAWKWILNKASHSDFEELSDAINEEKDAYFLAVDQDHFGSSEIRYTHDLDRNPRTPEECQRGAAILHQEVVLEDAGEALQDSGCLGFVDMSSENFVHPNDAAFMIADEEGNDPQPQYRPRRSPRLAALPSVCYKETPIRRKTSGKKKTHSARKAKE